MQSAAEPPTPAQNPFKYPREMDGLQSALSGLPTAAVYVLGVVLAAGLGGGAALGAGSALPGEGVPRGVVGVWTRRAALGGLWAGALQPAGRCS